MNYTYGLYIYENVGALDFVGPAEVFTISNYILQKGEVFTISEEAGPVNCIGGMTVVPDKTFDTSPPLDVLIVPGTFEPLLPKSETAIKWIGEQANQVRYIAAVCSGALILQNTGLLENRKATTHWMTLETLGKNSSITIMPDMRYVRDGNIITTQGVSAGIDMALWLVGQLHSPEHAREVKKLLQYDPAPPYMAEI